MTDRPDQEGAGRTAPPIGLIISGIIGLVLVIFIFSNNHTTEVNFLWLDTRMPMWAVILISGALGALLGWSIPALRRRSQRNK
ncbi:MAG: LapA family protein [Acidimicrobiia bacterium]